MSGILSIIIGLIFIAGGLSGKLALKGTHSGGQLAIVGGIIIVIGLIRVARAR